MMPFNEDLSGRLDARWRALADQLRWPDSSTKVFDDLVSRYSEPHRRYHSLTHLDSVLRVLEDLSSPAMPSVDAQLAAWFHDAIYEPMAADNEERSSDLAASALSRLGASGDLVASVCSLVIATKTHDAEVGAGAALLLDADLSILGAEADAYERYASGVRLEFADVPDEMYQQGRVAVLESFLQRTRIFNTSRGQELFEDAARANLRREIEGLRAA